MAAENTLRYIQVDYESHKQALLQRIRSRWPKVWNDFLSNSFGIVLVDLMAYTTAVLAFTINRLAGENYVSTMTLRESAVRIGRLVQYNLRGPRPATVFAEATLASPASADVSILAGTQIRSSDANALPFETSQAYTILAGNITPVTSILVMQSGLSGTNSVSSNAVVTNGSTDVDLVDTTVDLRQFLQVGQTFRVLPSDGITYTVQAIESAPGAVSFNRIVLDPPYAGATIETAAEVFDKRITLLQGQTITERFVSPATEAPSFTVQLSRNPVIDGTSVVQVNGETWTQVTSVVIQSPDSKAYEVRTFNDGTTIVIFGDGKFGAILPTNAVILVSYRVGGGSVGNIAVGTINTSISGFITSLNSPITVQVTNDTSSGVGGQDSESLEEARVNIPVFTRTNDRAVTLDDYRFFASNYSSPQFGSVKFARPFLRTQNALLEGNIVFVYAWTSGPGDSLVPLPPNLKTALQDFLRTKQVGTDYVLVGDGTERPVPVSLRFRTFDGFDVFATKRLVVDTITEFIRLLRPGDPVLQSKLESAVTATLGVDTVQIATPLVDLVADNPTELFVPPRDDFVFDIDRTAIGLNEFAAQLPIAPLEVWSFRLFLGTDELTIISDTTPGFARLLGTGLNTSDLFKSTVNLLTGYTDLQTVGSPGDLTMKLISVQGYDRERPLDIFIGYNGTNTLSKRREIRSNLRSWSTGVRIGEPIFATEVPGVLNSKSNITAVVEAVAGVTGVNRVAMGTPSSNDTRINANALELLKLGQIVLNNQVD